MPHPSDDPYQSWISQIRTSKKYRDMDLPEETVRDLFEQEMPRHRNPKDALHAVREKLHNIVAPYLGNPDYRSAVQDLDEAFDTGDPQMVKFVCAQLLASHASTRERLRILEEFYLRIFRAIGRPGSVLDIACGLNPLAFPWMGLPASVQYYAYDIIPPRIDLIRRFFERQGMQPLAFVQDVIVDPPTQPADVAFLFKEAHRIEQRQRGANRPLWEALNVRYLLVSLPTESLSGKHNLMERHRQMVAGIIEGLPWRVSELVFENEMVFVIDKRDGA